MINIKPSKARDFLDSVDIDYLIRQLIEGSKDSRLSQLRMFPLETQENRSPLEDCTAYVFGKTKIMLMGESGNLFHPEGYAEVSNPFSGDLVVYTRKATKKDIQNWDRFYRELGFDRPGFVPVHVGIFESDKLVRSKWGRGPVLLHEIDCVPAIYGDEVRFYRKRL